MTIPAPAATAASATGSLYVSTDTSTSRASSPTSAATRSISSDAGTAGRSPRADSPPTSMMSAPAAISARPRSSRAATSSSPRSSEKESGVALRMPISSGRAAELEPPLTGAQDHDRLIRSLTSLRVTLPALSTAATRSR